MQIIHILGRGHLPRNPDKESTSGIVRVALEIAKRQAGASHKVSIVGIGDHDWQVAWHRVQLVQVAPRSRAYIRIGSRAWDFRTHWPIANYVRQQSPEVVHGHGYYYFRGFRSGVRLAHFHSDPLYDYHGTALTVQDAAVIAGNSDMVLAVSNYVRRQLYRLLGDRGHVVVARNGVDLDRFRPTDDTVRAEWRRQWKIPRNAFLFGYAGSVVPEKGLDWLLSAFQRVATNDRPVHLVIAGATGLWAGEDTEIERRQRYAAQLQQQAQVLIDRVHWIGTIPPHQMASFYGMIDVLVIPSRYPDAAPLVAAEALACGVPVIAADVGGLPEMIPPRAGLVVIPDDVPGLAAALQAMVQLDSPAFRNMVEMARTHASQFSWDSTVSRVLEIYQHALNIRKSGGKRW
jgi:glycosyltransferase involved in cell wall biosynthesis